MINQITPIKELRLVIDAISEGLALTTSQDNPGITYNVRKAAKAAVNAKAWLGVCLEEIGTENPYKDDYKKPEDIVDTADKAFWNKNDHDVKAHGYLENILYFKGNLKNISVLVKDINTGEATNPAERPSREFAIARTNAWTCLRQAGFWLGYELADIKKKNENKGL